MTHVMLVPSAANNREWSDEMKSSGDVFPSLSCNEIAASEGDLKGKKIMLTINQSYARSAVPLTFRVAGGKHRYLRQRPRSPARHRRGRLSDAFWLLRNSE